MRLDGDRPRRTSGPVRSSTAADASAVIITRYLASATSPSSFLPSRTVPSLISSSRVIGAAHATYVAYGPSDAGSGSRASQAVSSCLVYPSAVTAKPKGVGGDVRAITPAASRPRPVARRSMQRRSDDARPLRLPDRAGLGAANWKGETPVTGVRSSQRGATPAIWPDTDGVPDNESIAKASRLGRHGRDGRGRIRSYMPAASRVDSRPASRRGKAHVRAETLDTDACAVEFRID
jgi:hypothetical protein